MSLGTAMETPASSLVSNAEDNSTANLAASSPSSNSSDNKVEAEGATAVAADAIYKLVIQPGIDEPFDVHVNAADMVQEIHHVLLEREGTCHRTCFSLQLNGQPLDSFSEIRNVAGMTDGSVLQAVDDPYTLRDAKLHIRHIRDLLRAPDIIDGANAVESASLTFMPTIQIQHDKDKPFDGYPTNAVFPGTKDRCLARVLPAYPKYPEAIKNISISPFNPPVGPRKLKGDVLYLDIDAVEKRMHVTCCSKGFFVNGTTPGKFSPNPHPHYKGVYTTLVDLLNAVSPAFKKAYPIIIKHRSDRHILERMPTTYPVYSWISAAPDYAEDFVRAEDSTQPARVGFEDHLPGQIRDWNEEIQVTHEMSHASMNERSIRDRSIYKIHGDFISAAVKGALNVAEKNVVSINPGDDPKTQMYLWNNIFYSLGFDVKDHYKELGGDAAAFAATSIDLHGIKAYTSLEDSKVCTLGMAVIDYKGCRISAQSVIPGILEREQEQSVVYGSVDFGKTVVSSEKYHEILEPTAKELRILPHEVYSGKNEGEIVKLYSSFETKGIVGNDGRYYILDLLRSMPPDVHFIEGAEVSEKAKERGFPRKAPHKLSCLRRELVQHFYDDRSMMFVRVAVRHIRETIMECTDKEAKETLEKDASVALMEVSKGSELNTANTDIKTAVEKAAEAVHSLNKTSFDIRFNPDCYTTTVKHPPTEDLKKQRQLLIDASEFLLTHQIPELVQHCLELSVAPADGVALSELMHARGINIRYLGEMASMLPNRSTYIRTLIVSEIVARCLKHILRSYIYAAPQDQMAFVLSHILNTVFGSDDNRASPVGEKAKKGNKKGNKRALNGGEWLSLKPKDLWKSVCEESLSYFGYDLQLESVEHLVEQFGVQKISLLRRLCLFLGIQLIAKDYMLDVAGPQGKPKIPFTEDDIAGIFPVYRHRNPGSNDAKKMLQRSQQATQTGQLREAYEFCNEAINLMHSAYGPLHEDMVQALRHMARLSYILGDVGDALSHQHRATLVSERCHGLDSVFTIHQYLNLAHYAFSNLLISAALRLLYRARSLLLIVFGEKHPTMAQIDGNIGVILFAVHEFDSSVRFLQSAMSCMSYNNDDKSLVAGMLYHILARGNAARGDFRAALAAEKETNSIYESVFGAHHDKTKESYEFMKTLTAQAVSFQKKVLDATTNGSATGKHSNLASILPVQMQKPSLTAMIDILNVINGIVVFSLSAPTEASEEKTEGSAEQTADQETKPVEDVPLD